VHSLHRWLERCSIVVSLRCCCCLSGITFPEDVSGGHPFKLQQLKQWIDESYRAIANKTQIKQIDVDLS